MPEEAPKSILTQEYKAIDQQYRRDVAILGVRPLMTRVFFAAWTVLDIGLIAFFLLVVPLYLVSGAFADSRSMAEIGYNSAATHAVTAAGAPQSLMIGSARAITAAGANDVIADVENPNAAWYADFTYYFLFDGGETEKEEGFVLPGSTATLASLAIKEGARSPRLVLEDINWHRVNRHEVEDLSDWLTERSTFPISDIIYANNIGLDGVAIGQTDFTLTNRTAYSYWEPKFLVLLERSGNIAAVTEVTVNDFQSGEARKVNVRWFDAVPATASVRVIPVVNYFDESLYMDPEE